MNDELPTSFYKYYSVKGAIATLCHETKRWTKPSSFNDPFDNQFIPIIDKATEENVDKHRKTLNPNETRKAYSDYPEGNDYVCNLIEQLKKSIPISENPYFKNHDDDIKIFLEKQRLKYLKYPEQFKRKNFEKALVKFQIKSSSLSHHIIKHANSEDSINEGYKYISNTVTLINNYYAIFCISKIKDSILMWSHYAESHKGAIVEFSSITGIKEVKYSEYIPTTPHILNTGMDKIAEYSEDLIGMILYTKANCWKYEKEWRAIHEERNNPKDYIDLPFERREVVGIYLGCRMEDERRKEIMNIAKEKYSWAKIYQARTHETNYELVFDEII